MDIKIGDRTVALTRTDEIKEQLIATTGSSVAETLAMLAHTQIAGDVAAPLLALASGPDLPSMPLLASEIATAGVHDVAAQFAAFLSADNAPELAE